MKKKEVGELGELCAEKFLTSQNYRCLRKNYHCRWGEIDLIMLSPQQEIVFVEIKTRTSAAMGEGEESITPRKMQKILRTAMIFLMESKEIDFVTWRIDMIALKLSKQYRVCDIRHYKNILDGR